jgi:endonuclease/exonuclease/phosphatase family metal-dependent hydrolase
MRGRLWLLAVAGLCFLAAQPARADADKRVVKVMTRNMDAGTDFEWFFVIPDVTLAAQATFTEVLGSNIPGRAALLAKEIATEQPDLIALEEVTTWQAGPPGGAPTVVLDQLHLLLEALTAEGQHYAVVAKQSLASASLPLSSTEVVSFTDHDVILARTDLRHSEMDLSNVQQGIYQAVFEFPVGTGFLPIPRGWLSVDVKVRGKVLRFFCTHLESTVAGIPSSTTVQVAQADELLAIAGETKMPVVLAGDFNANAEIGPDHTATTDHILAAGFTDTWRVFNPPGTGFTWPLYLEDFLTGTPVAPFERIDLVYARRLNTIGVAQSGLLPPWPSDHVGVVSTVQLEP